MFVGRLQCRYKHRCEEGFFLRGITQKPRTDSYSTLLPRYGSVPVPFCLDKKTTGCESSAPWQKKVSPSITLPARVLRQQLSISNQLQSNTNLKQPLAGMQISTFLLHSCVLPFAAFMIGAKINVRTVQKCSHVNISTVLYTSNLFFLFTVGVSWAILKNKNKFPAVLLSGPLYSWYVN